MLRRPAQPPSESGSIDFSDLSGELEFDVAPQAVSTPPRIGAATSAAQRPTTRGKPAAQPRGTPAPLRGGRPQQQASVESFELSGDLSGSLEIDFSDPAPARGQARAAGE